MPTESETERRVDLARTLKGMENKIDNNTTMTQEIHESLYGNGKPGLKAEVYRLKWAFGVLISFATYVGYRVLI